MAMLYEELSRKIREAATEVHKTLGPGLLEATYERCLAIEFDLRKISYQRQLVLPVRYKNVDVGDAYRIDFLVDDLIVVEIKAVRGLLPIHEAQVLTYLRLSGKRLGLLMNFHEVLLKDGVRRLVL